MFCSKFILSKAASSLANTPYAMHQRLADAFPHGNVHTQRDETRGYLFSSINGVVNVQSALRPNFDKAFKNAMHLISGTPVIKEIECNYVNGQVKKFRLKTIPTFNLSENEKRKRMAFVDPDDIINWFDSRTNKWGFQPRKCFFSKLSPEKSEKRMLDENKKPKLLNMTWLPVLFEGELIVTNQDDFKRSIICGVGSHKGMGYGLILLND